MNSKQGSATRNQTNYYEILEIPVDFPQGDIHKAYLRAKSTYSQENPALYTMFTKEEARELAQMIEEAYAVLGNPSSRQEYDRTLQDQLREQARHHQNPPSDYQAAITVTTQTVTEVTASTPPTPSSSRLDLDQTFTVRKRETGKASLAEGMGRTPLSVYPIDEAMEQDIANATEITGSFLKTVREYKKVSLEKMSEATRISKSYLSAVESEDVTSLPAAVFVRGFVVQICRLLGLEESKYVTAFMNRFKGLLEKQR